MFSDLISSIIPFKKWGTENIHAPPDYFPDFDPGPLPGLDENAVPCEDGFELEGFEGLELEAADFAAVAIFWVEARFPVPEPENQLN